MVVLVYPKSASVQRSGTAGSAQVASRDATPPVVAPVPNAADEVFDGAQLVNDGSSSQYNVSFSVTPGAPINQGPSASSATAGPSVADLLDDSLLDDSDQEDSQKQVTSDDRGLLKDASVRADQQAQCRTTMLSLKEAFEGALGMQAKMDALRKKDRDKIAALQARHKVDQARIAELMEMLANAQDPEARRRIVELMAELEVYKQREEDNKVEEWRGRLKDKKGVFGLILALSRDAHPLGSLGGERRPSKAPHPIPDVANFYNPSGYHPETADGPASDKQRGTASGREGAASGTEGSENKSAADASKLAKPHLRKAQSSLGLQASSPEAEAEAEMHASRSCMRSKTVSAGSLKQPPKLASGLTNAPVVGAAATEAGGRAVGDNLTLSWVLQLWSHHVRSKQHRRDLDKGVQASPQAVEMQCQTEEDFEAERKRLEDEILDLKHDLRESEKCRLQAEQERDVLAGKLAEANQSHSSEREHLLNEILRIQRESQIELGKRDNEIKQLTQKLASSQDAFQRAQAAWENEKKQLQATIRSVTSDLQNALTQCRRMELLVAKLKKEGAGALKDKIAQLIAELEKAKDRLSGAIRDRDKAELESDLLGRRNGHLQRKMELERQFLPLIHAAQGPVAHMLPKTQMNKTSNSQSQPNLPSLGAPEMLR